jgi:hypothetical protein
VLLCLRRCHASQDRQAASDGPSDRRSRRQRCSQLALTVLHHVHPHWQDPGQGRPRRSQHSLADLRPVLRPSEARVPGAKEKAARGWRAGRGRTP